MEGRNFSCTADYRYTVQDGEAGRSSSIRGNDYEETWRYKKTGLDRSRVPETEGMMEGGGRQKDSASREDGLDLCHPAMGRSCPVS